MQLQIQNPQIQATVMFGIGVGSAIIGSYTNAEEVEKKLPETLLRVADYATATLMLLGAGNLFYKKNFLLGSLSLGFSCASVLSRWIDTAKSKTLVLVATAMFETLVFVAVKQSNFIMKKVSQLKLS